MSTPTADITTSWHGTLVLLHPGTEIGQQWLDDHVDPNAPMIGKAVAVEPRFVNDIVYNMRCDGLAIDDDIYDDEPLEPTGEEE